MRPPTVFWQRKPLGFKKYYPVEFLASQMSIEQNDSDKLIKYIRDAKKHGFYSFIPSYQQIF